MNYSWVHDVERGDSRLLYARIDESEHVVLRDRYKALQCQRCRRFNCLTALEAGIDPDVAIDLRRDLCITWDGVVCLSRRLDELLQNAGIGGYRTFDIPGDDNFVAIWIELLAKVDLSVAQYRFHGPQCPLCNRWHEITRNPLSLRGIEPPGGELVLFAPEIRMYGTKWPKAEILMSENLVTLLRAEKITGIVATAVRH